MGHLPDQTSQPYIDERHLRLAPWESHPHIHYKKFDMPAGDYSYYAMSVESLFYDPALVCLEEYGIPLEISRKIEKNICFNGNLDLTIDKLKSINIQNLPLTQFEKRFLERSMKYF